LRGRRKKVEPVRLGELLPEVMREMRPRRSSALQRVRGAWREVVGEPVAHKTRVTGLSGGILEVEVASAALKHHLGTFRREEIQAALRDRLGAAAPRGIRFRVGSG
jgi:predicted nucleic acid-binding Zn ribbon protein